MNITSSQLPRVALIAGPTASGKSSLALMLAERIGGVVINADSAQVYRDLRVVSARPDADDMARAPHRLYGIRDGASPFSAADWAQAARSELEDAWSVGALPILAGGTGLYLRTLIDGIAPVPEIDPDIRAAVRTMNVAEAHAALAREDPEAAARLRPSDTSRVARALEVVRSTGTSLSVWQQRMSGGLAGSIRLTPLILLPPREWLYARCDARFATIFSEPGIAEVEALLARGLDLSLPVMRAIGVPEIAAWLRGEMDREAAMEAGRSATRRYAKRQFTWFRRQSPPDWPRFEQALDVPADFDAALSLLDTR